MKKITSIWIVLLLIHLQFANTIAYGVVDENEIFTTIDNSTGLTITGYLGEAKDVNIPKVINDKPVTAIGREAFKSKQLTSVIIPNSVTSIGFYAFAYNKLKSVTIPDSVTFIDDNAFFSNQLTSVTISNSLTSINGGVFNNNQLMSVEIPNGVTNIGNAAFGFNNLKVLIIPESVTSISTYAFHSNQLNQIEFLGKPKVEENSFERQYKFSYSFNAWYTDNEFSNKWDGVVSKPMTIYAKFLPNSIGFEVIAETTTVIGDPLKITVNEKFSDGTTIDRTSEVTFTSSDEEIVKVEDNKLIAVASGTVTITAEIGEKTVTATITIDPKTSNGLTITPTKDTATVGDTLSFTVNEEFSDGTTKDRTSEVTFTSSNEAIVKVEDNKLIAVASGTVTITAKIGEKTVTATITIEPKPVTSNGLTITPTKDTATVGDTLSFTVNEEFSDGTTKDRTSEVTFTSSNEAIVKVEDNKLIAVASGTVTITAKIGEKTATATVTVKERVVPPTPQPPYIPTPEPTSPADKILIEQVNENGEDSYRGEVTAQNIQAIASKWTKDDERVVRIQYPVEAATKATILHVKQPAVEQFVKEQADLFLTLENGTIRAPYTSLNGLTDDLFFRIIPIKSNEQKVLEQNAQQNEQVQAVTGKNMTVTLFGQPISIETNLQNRPVTITLPIPVDVTEEQLASIFVYIEHSDGSTEVKRGRIVEMASDIKGYAFEVTHFSSFSLMYATEEMKAPEEKISIPYIQGYSDGTFKPNAPVTRAQMATMLARFLTNGMIPSAEATFTDTKNSASKDAIEYVKQAGLLNGVTATSFNPNGTITRAQMAGVVARWIDTVCTQDHTKSFCQTAQPGKAFTDVKATHWATQAIEQVSALGIMSGNSATTFNPSGSLTRAQAVKVLNQLFERPVAEAITQSTFKDVPVSHWAIGEIEAAATEIIIEK